jgi:hypothetical protein
LTVENLYSDSGLQLNREWDFKEVRDSVIAQISNSTSIGELSQLLLKLDQGFSCPHYLRYKTDQSQMQQEEEEQLSEDQESQGSDEEESSKENQSDEEMKDDNVKVIKLKFFKYWPSKSMRSAWREYVF